MTAPSKPKLAPPWWSTMQTLVRASTRTEEGLPVLAFPKLLVGRTHRLPLTQQLKQLCMSCIADDPAARL